MCRCGKIHSSIAGSLRANRLKFLVKWLTFLLPTPHPGHFHENAPTKFFLGPMVCFKERFIKINTTGVPEKNISKLGNLEKQLVTNY